MDGASELLLSAADTALYAASRADHNCESQAQ
jgi:hypothetical protein